MTNIGFLATLEYVPRDHCKLVNEVAMNNTTVCLRTRYVIFPNDVNTKVYLYVYEQTYNNTFIVHNVSGLHGYCKRDIETMNSGRKRARRRKNQNFYAWFTTQMPGCSLCMYISSGIPQYPLLVSERDDSRLPKPRCTIGVSGARHSILDLLVYAISQQSDPIETVPSKQCLFKGGCSSCRAI